MKLYIAACFEERYRLRPYAKKIKQMGHKVLADWLSDRVDSLDMEDVETNAIKDATRDLDNVIKCDILILDTIVNNTRGGKYVEEGGLLMWNRLVERGYLDHISKDFWIVGPRTNVFTYKCKQVFKNWDDCIEFMKIAYVV